MNAFIQSIVAQFSAAPTRLFAVDGLGALSTAVFITILARFENVVGMPRTTLYFLASVAFIYAAFGFCCYFLNPKNWALYLKALSTANILYCCLTIGLMAFFFQRLTIVGFIYFSLEIIIISSLAYIERQVISTN